MGSVHKLAFPKTLLTRERMFYIIRTSLLDFVWYIGGIKMDEEERREKEFYRNEIRKILDQVDDLSVDKYFYNFVIGKLKIKVG